MSGSALFKPMRYVAEAQTTDGVTLVSFAAVIPEAAGPGFTLATVGFRWELLGKTAAGNGVRFLLEGIVAPIAGVPVAYGIAAPLSSQGLAALLLAVPTIAVSYANSRITLTPKVTGVAATTVNWVSWLDCTVH